MTHVRLTKMKIAIILGTRPEIIKLSPVIRACISSKIDFFIIHTNQHYSANMDSIFFKELELPLPKYNLNINSSFHGEMTGKMMDGIEKILIKELPTVTVVQGDTNTVLAGALAASKLLIPVAHVEAGLRSYDRSMPEEINRVVTDHVSSFLFAPTKKQADILVKEAINKSSIFTVGNTIVDAVFQNIKLLEKHKELHHYQNEEYFLLTIHRPSNVDKKKSLESIIRGVSKLALLNNKIIYFPIHPRTRKNLKNLQIKIDKKIIKLMDPVGYLEMLSMERNAKLILTDSGGVQEEACILGVPSITLRENTERPETIEVGANMLAGSDEKKIIFKAGEMLKKSKDWLNPFGEGNSGETIIGILLEKNNEK